MLKVIRQLFFILIQQVRQKRPDTPIGEAAEQLCLL
jgi:hypothetical protein